MRSRFLLLPVAATFAAAFSGQAQSAPKPVAKPAATAVSSAAKLPPGVLPAHGIVKTALALTYQDIRIGTGAAGEEKQLWKVKYTGWRAADGVIFDAWDKHPQPVLGPDGKPVMGPDGKPKLGDPQPMEFPHGVGRMIPGFDLGVKGMRVGGKRRIFVPSALAYGPRAMPDRGPDHPGIPANSDLVFDVELVSVAPLPAPPQPGGPAPGTGMRPVPQPAAPGQPSAPATAPSTPPVPQPKPATPPGK